MDQTESHIRQNIEETRAAMSEKIEMIEERVHETVEGTTSTIDNVIGNINRVKEAIEQTKSAIDSGIDTIRQAIDETVERVKYTTDLIEQVNQNPWIMLSSAVLVGYVFGSLNRRETPDMSPAHESGRAHEPAKPNFTPQHSAASPVSR
jgi:ElaB/YqjD/DUF883 family membrane-anchored ribosome-binding protein